MITLVLALLAGGLFALSLPPFNVEWLAWFAIAPLFVAARERRGLEALGLGLLAGALCGFIHVGWHTDATALRFGYLPFLWLAMLFGVTAMVAASAGRRAQGVRWALLVACAGVAAEWLTTFSPLPLNVAASQHRTLPVVQIAALTGVWGVSFLVWFANAAIADAFLHRNPRSPAVAAAGGALAAGLVYGFVALANTPADGQVLRVAAIQDHSISETAHLAEPSSLKTDEVDREELTRRAAARGAKLIVWTEGGLGSSFTPDDPENETAKLARKLDTHLVVGYSADPYNCAAIVAPDGKTKGVHHKIRLFLGERQSVRPGRTATAFPTDLGKVGVEICFDSCYTGITRSVAAAGAQIIAMPNYDPPTPNGVLHHLHGALLPFRAVENHVPFVRADPTGISQIIDARGRIVAASPLWAGDALVADVALGNGGGTLFTRLGDWFAYVCAVVSAVGLAGAVRRHRRDKRAAAAPPVEDTPVPVAPEPAPSV